MQCYEMLNEIDGADEGHFRALVGARGARMDDEMDPEFIKMLKEEGYEIGEEVA